MLIKLNMKYSNLISLLLFVVLAGCGGYKLKSTEKNYIDTLMNKKLLPVIDSIDTSDVSSLYHSQIKLMIPVDYYNYSSLKNQNAILNKFIKIIESLPSLSELRAKERIGNAKLDDFYIDESRSGTADRKVFPTQKNNGTIFHSPLSLLQFNYLFSQLAKKIVVKSKTQQLRLNERQFLKISVGFLSKDLIKPLYLEVESWWYSQVGNYPSMQARIEDKLNYINNDKLKRKSYFSAFIEEELFLTAIASDLKFISNNYSKNNIDVSLLDAILDNNFAIFDRRLKAEGFLFDIGKWTDHPEYQYANYKKLDYPTEKYPKQNVSWDNSHSYRFPFWLKSYRDAFTISSNKYEYYDGLMTRFANQMKKVIIYNQNGPYFTNYIDGSNGWFRLKKDRNTGYGPYTLSTIGQYGSWYLLDGDGIDRYFQLMKSMIVSDDKEVIQFRTNYYGDYDYTKKINPRGLRSIDLMGKGSLAELYVLMANTIKNHAK